MSILFGHPTGNPFSHHAGLAHFETGRLEAFCVPWMPTPAQLRCLRGLPGLNEWTARLERRFFPPLEDAPRKEGIAGEWLRMARRVLSSGQVDEQVAWDANGWLMRTMARECRRPRVTAVHAYEDCSLLQFREAKRVDKACVYDMPIGYYASWDQTRRFLAKRFVEWLPFKWPASTPSIQAEQKRKEMSLADAVLAPSTFVLETIRRSFPNKRVFIAPYGVDCAFWRPSAEPPREGPIRFLYAGQISVRKGIPILIEAWKKADLKDAELELAGSWCLASDRRRSIPPTVKITGACSLGALRTRYQAADAFVFPSFFEGFGLVLLEAMACGLPVVTTEATAGTDILSDKTGRVFQTGDVDALVDSLRWFAANRDQSRSMRPAARATAEACSWQHYRRCVSEGVAAFV
jgi:alpha-maltose-1-phosphate synthase